MASSSPLPFLLTLSWLLGSLGVGRSGEAGAFVLDVHHRFSDSVRRWAESASWETSDVVWPEKGTLGYYATLAEHDRALLHRRGLAGAGGQTVLTFEDGNQTIRLSRLGFLHYALVRIGTPKVQFLVALDTGSDLFWVPCDCMSCAPTVSDELNVKFNNYNSSRSTTAKRVPCSSGMCVPPQNSSSCSGPSDPCPYKVEYLSAGLSTSGILLEDVLYLRPEGRDRQEVQARITFGCGRVQTGGFLRNAAPNGVFGLGMGKISVPSALADAGHTPYSFSMCFARDGMGRIRFGDEGSTDQQETRLIPNRLQVYAVHVTGIQLHDKQLVESFPVIVDSGSSFTILRDPIYTNISKAFDSLVQDKRHEAIPDFPFEYCYTINDPNEPVIVPNITLFMSGGSRYPIIDPVLFVRTDEDYLYCLAIIKTNTVNIIGQNFMTGLKIVFDSEKGTLGWKESNCYDIGRNSTTTVSPGPSSTTPPQSPSPSTPSSADEPPLFPSPTAVNQPPPPRSPNSVEPQGQQNTSDVGNRKNIPPSPSQGRSLTDRNSFMAGLLLLPLLLIP